jgi:hypothetical protein
MTGCAASSCNGEQLAARWLFWYSPEVPLIGSARAAAPQAEFVEGCCASAMTHRSPRRHGPRDHPRAAPNALPEGVRRGGSGERSVARLGESTHTRCGRGPASAHGADQAAPTRQPSCSHRDHCPDTSRRDPRDERDPPATPVPRWGHPSSTPTALTQHLWNQVAMAKPVVSASDGGVWLWEAVCSPLESPPIRCRAEIRHG